MNLPNIDKIHKLLVQIPLYKQRGREEIFLGIKKSKHKKWIGWKFINQLKAENKFPQCIMESGLYDLAVNFWILYCTKYKLSLEILEKSYEF